MSLYVYKIYKGFLSEKENYVDVLMKHTCDSSFRLLIEHSYHSSGDEKDNLIEALNKAIDAALDYERNNNIES